MKSVDLLCASPASTAICSSMDKHSMVRQGGIRPLDHQRHSHRLGDHHHRHKAKTKTPIIPCSSQIPISPKPYLDKFRKSTSSSSTPRLSLELLRRKSSADITDLSRPPAPSGSSSSRYLLSDTPLLIDLLSSSDDSHHSSSTTMVRQPLRNIGSKKNHYFNDYPVFRSSLLSAHSYDNPVFESSSPSLRPNGGLHAQKASLSRSNHAQKSPSLSRVHDDSHVQKSSLFRTSASHASKSSLAFTDESHAFTKSGRPRDQVVELRVSIHCKGCEGKIRKHISRMEGVTSFTIDLATKKVTVIGNVTPLGVLTSISKVKNAEFWSSPTPPSSSSSTATTTTTSSTGMSIVSN